MMTGNIYNELNRAFSGALLKSETNRLNIHSEFAAFYNNDYESICDYLREATLNNPFSAATLENLRFRHVNIIRKTLRRITSGIFTRDPIIKLKDANPEQEQMLSGILENSRFIAKIKEAFSKAVYFNTVEAHAVWDSELNDIRIDIITPDNYTVETGSNYLEKKQIAVRKADENGEIYWSFWSENEHYLIKNDEKTAPPNNKSMVNPYLNSADKKYSLPFAVLRIDEGNDYFGEPNWNIFLHQKNLDIRLTDLNETELKTLHQVYFGVNTNFTKDETFRAGDFKQINNVKSEDKDPRIDSITSNVNYGSVRDNVDWHNRLVLMSEGINGSSASTELKAESGAAKLIDELELLERREEFKTILYHFMHHLLNVTRVVWNYYNPRNSLPDNDFEIRFVDLNIFESVDDKKKKYDMALEYGYKDEIDIAMEELEISEEEAAERIRSRKERREQTAHNKK
jgi:hypothetical protein